MQQLERRMQILYSSFRVVRKLRKIILICLFTCVDFYHNPKIIKKNKKITGSPDYKNFKKDPGDNLYEKIEGNLAGREAV